MIPRRVWSGLLGYSGSACLAWVACLVWFWRARGGSGGWLIVAVDVGDYVAGGALGMKKSLVLCDFFLDKIVFLMYNRVMKKGLCWLSFFLGICEKSVFILKGFNMIDFTIANYGGGFWVVRSGGWSCRRGYVGYSRQYILSDLKRIARARFNVKRAHFDIFDV